MYALEHCDYAALHLTSKVDLLQLGMAGNGELQHDLLTAPSMVVQITIPFP